jgi:hypothetical protein
VNFCIYFDKNFIVQGLTCLDTIKKYNPVANFFILSVDKFTEKKIHDLNLSYVHTVKLSSLFKKFPILKKEKRRRSKLNFFFLLTPFFIYYLLKKKISPLFYVDADLVFFTSIKKIDTIFKKFDIMASYHDRTYQVDLGNGKYNVGFLCFKNKKNVTNQVLKWSKQCLISTTLEKSFAEIICGDQKYLNSWELNKKIRFSGIKVDNFNIGAWNIDNYKFSSKKNNLLCNGKKLICIHTNFVKFEKNNNFFTSVRKKVFLNIELKKIYENVCLKYKINLKNNTINNSFLFFLIFMIRKYILKNLFVINYNNK